MDQKRDFDAVAATWDENPERVTRTRAIADAMLGEFPLRPDMRVMDYGCGTGLVTLALQPHVASVLAADHSEGMLAQLAEKLTAAGITNVSTLRCDLEEEEWTGEPLDVIVSSMALHHMREAATVVRKLAGALKPGGWLAIADLGQGSEAFHGDATGVFHHGFGEDEMRGMFEAAGLTAVRTSEATRMVRETGDFPVLLTVGRKA